MSSPAASTRRSCVDRPSGVSGWDVELDTTNASCGTEDARGPRRLLPGPAASPQGVLSVAENGAACPLDAHHRAQSGGSVLCVRASNLHSTKIAGPHNPL